MGIKIAIDWANILARNRLTSWNISRELQVSIPTLLASQLVNILVLTNSRLDVQKKAFWRVGIKTRNEILPNDFKMLSKKAFSKKKLKVELFDFLKADDSYVEWHHFKIKKYNINTGK